MGALIFTEPPYTPVYSSLRRLIIVRCDAKAVYEELHVRFANDPVTLIIYDRRQASTPSTSGPQERRRSEEAGILETRGFYVLRLRGPRRVRNEEGAAPLERRP
jgi:hypothetical protein